MTVSKSLRLGTVVVSVLILTACDALNPNAASSKIKTYESVWINARWGSGRTGSPETKTVEPHHSGYCPPTSLFLENHSTRFQSFFSFSNKVLVFYNNCAAPAELLVCATSGSGGNSSEFPVCNQDPRTTPLSRLASISMGPADNTTRSATWRETGLELNINIFYCAVGDTFTAGVISGANPTDCLE